jgi:hypothetical protein
MKFLKEIKKHAKRRQGFHPADPAVAQVLHLRGSQVFHLYGNCGFLEGNYDTEKAEIMKRPKAEKAGLRCCRECSRTVEYDKFFTGKIKY